MSFRRAAGSDLRTKERSHHRIPKTWIRARVILGDVRPADIPVVHFVVLCMLPVLSLLYVARFRGRRPLRGRVLSALAVLVVWFLSIPALMSYCGGGRENPQFQAMVPFSCALAIALAVHTRGRRWAGVAGAFAAFVFLMTTYSTAVNSPLYVGTKHARHIDPARIAPEWHTSITHIYRVQAAAAGGCTEARPN